MSPKDSRSIQMFILEEYAPPVTEPEARERFFIALATIALYHWQFKKLPWHPYRKARNCFRAARKRASASGNPLAVKQLTQWTLDLAQKALH